LKLVALYHNRLSFFFFNFTLRRYITATDVCLNFMPLFHVGGICRNLLAPLLSGGATVAMPFFDVSDFWTVAVNQRCTWYYGGVIRVET